MGFLSDYYGKRSSDFVYGFLAAMDLYAIWIGGEQTMGVRQTPLKQAMQEAVSELAENPEDFKGKINSYT